MSKNCNESDNARGLVNRSRLHGRDLMLAQRLAHDLQAARQGAQRNERSVAPEASDRMVPTRDFSGLTSSACALAKAAAMLPIDSLERCTTTLRFEQIKADSA